MAEPTPPDAIENLPESLIDLRRSIDATDNAILELLAQRKALVTEIAHVKREHTLAVRDRTREANILEQRELACTALGLRTEVVESLFRVVLAASRDHQAALGTELPRNLPKRTVAIVGGEGGMGSLFATMFRDLGQEVIVADLDTAIRPIDAASQADAVLVSVPMDVTNEVIETIGPACREDALLWDVTSTKAGPVEAMCAASTCDVIGTHPMFGPNVHSLQEQRIVIVPGRLRPNSTWKMWLETCLQARGLTLLHASAEEHDRMMAIVQVLTHFSTEIRGLALAQMGASVHDTLRFASPVYLIDLLMTARHFCQSPDLYASIHQANPYAKEVAHALETSLQRWTEAVQADDNTAFRSLFETCHNYFGTFSEEALERSSFLIDRIVERT